MNEHDIEEALKKATDDIQIPEALNPEAIPELLEGVEQKQYERMWYRKPWLRAVAAVVLVSGLGFGIFAVTRGIHSGVFQDTHINTDTQVVDESAEADNKDTDTGKSDLDSEDILTAPVAIRTPESKRELRLIFRDFEKEYAKDYDVVYEAALDAEETVGASSNSPGVQGNPDYYETNAQVKSVAEADIVKTDGAYIYSCYSPDSSYIFSDIQITSAKDGELSDVTTITKEDFDQALEKYFHEAADSATYATGIREMYIQDTNLVVLYQAIVNNGYRTIVFTIDVSNPENPKFVGTLSQEGYYSTSRLTDGDLYVFTSTHKDVSSGSIFGNKYNYFPVVEDKNLDISDIYLPECYDSPTYQIMTGIDLDSPNSFASKKAILSGSGTYYVSEDHIYFAQTNYDNGRQTELMKFDYADGKITPVGSVDFAGYLLNQFSMDEYDGVLRVVASVDASYNQTIVYPSYSDELEMPVTYQEESNALYCIDEDMNLIGCIKNLAPNERVYSVRFMGDTGYFVTYRETDPLFSVDLSNPKKPRIMDALKIPGFSSYMHPYSEDLLLGFGEEIHPETGEFLGLKLSMFNISDPYDIREEDKEVLEDGYNSPSLTNHKSIFIAPDKNLFGFYVSGYNRDTYESINHYVLYSYDDKKGFTEECYIDLNELDHNYDVDDYSYRWTYDDANARCIYIGDYLYLVNGSAIVSFDMEDYRVIDQN